MRKIKVVVLLVRQLQHGFTKNAKVSPNLTVTHIYLFFIFLSIFVLECFIMPNSFFFFFFFFFFFLSYNEHSYL